MLSYDQASSPERWLRPGVVLSNVDVVGFHSR